MSSIAHTHRRSASPQVIEGQYLDQTKLISLLKNVYGCDDGKNNFRVELRLNRYKIYPLDDRDPLELTEDQLQDCRIPRRR